MKDISLAMPTLSGSLQHHPKLLASRSKHFCSGVNFVWSLLSLYVGLTNYASNQKGRREKRSEGGREGERREEGRGGGKGRVEERKNE